MPDQDKQNPTTGSESDISKAQSQQQPPNQASQQQSQTGERQGQFETGQQGGAELTGDQAATGQGQGGARPRPNLGLIRLNPMSARPCRFHSASRRNGALFARDDPC